MATVFTIKRKPKQTRRVPELLLCQGNALHLPLQDNSVNCCVTSPPYYGLRDYGTGTWSGGDLACAHSKRTSISQFTTTQSRPTNLNHEREGWRGGVCGRCGAVQADLQMGLEATPDAYVRVMAQVFREVKRVLRDDGVLFLNIGDTYWGGGGGNYGSGKAVKGREGVHLTNVRNRATLPGIPAKSLLGIPWRVALALQRSGWILRSEIIWEKTNVMPESVKDRPTKAHEQVFLFSKQPHYFYDQEAIKEPAKDWGTRDRSTSKHNTNGYRKAGQTPHSGFTNGNQATTGRNARSVWSFATQPFSGAHFAVFPPELVRRCLLAGCPPRGVVLDPFCGSGTTMLVARELGHHGVGVDLSWPYLHTIARKRLGYSI